MSDTKHETIADILADMRRDAADDDYTEDCILGQSLNEYADRIEAANKRERDATPGNAAAMREALKAIDGNTDLLDIAEGVAPNLHPSHSFVAVQIRKIVRAALAAPPRNCDVGTADEQADRFKAFCYSNRTPGNECSKECPFNDTSAVCYCQARWAQMPFVKAEGGAE